MRAITEAAQVTGYAVWFAAAWALANRVMLLLYRVEGELRRRKNARRMERWKPEARPRDTAHDATTVMPAIGRPSSGRRADRATRQAITAGTG